MLSIIIICVQFSGCSFIIEDTEEIASNAMTEAQQNELSAVDEYFAEADTADVVMPMKYAGVQYWVDYEKTPVQEKENGFIADEDVIKPAINAANQQLELLPDNIWEKFCKMGWTLTLEPKILYMSDGSYCDSTIIGLCNKNNRTITLSAVSSAYIQRSLLHEFGHFVYYQLDRESRSKLMEIYEENLYKEAVAGYSVHCLQNENEYFAESFKRYMRGQETEGNIADFINTAISTI